jgi:hypothetical protein
MSDSPTDTSAIEDKKSKNSTNLSYNIPKFIITLIILIFIIIIYFSFGGLTLYACKLAQSNILPTESKCFPYTYYKPKIDEISTNIFNTFTNPSLSMKLKFPYNEYNSSNKIIDLFRNYKNEPDSNFLMNYFIQIIESLILFNYSSFNFMLNGLNTIPETLIILLGPIIVLVFSLIIFLCDHLYVIYLWFSSMNWFFKTNKNEAPIGKPIWTTVSILDPTNFACSIGMVILFCFLFWVLLIGLPVLPFITIMICIFTIITYKAEMNNNSITALTVIKDLFKYYKTTIMAIFSILVVLSAFTNLGKVPGIISLLILVSIYFGLLSIDLFKPNNETNLSTLVSYKQAIKQCNLNEPLKKKHGFLYNLLSGGSGTNLTKDLKKISKQINSFNQNPINQ